MGTTAKYLLRALRDFALSLLLLAALAYAFFQLPYKEWTQTQLTAALGRAGIQFEQFTVETVSPFGLELTDIALAHPAQVTASRFLFNAAAMDIWMDDVKFAAMPALPPLQLRMKARFDTASGIVSWNGDLFDTTRAAEMQFIFSYAVNNPDARTLTIQKALLPWEGGTLSTSNATVTFGKKGTPANIPITVTRIPLQTVMQGVLGPEVKATGHLNGVLPLLIDANGQIALGTGAITAGGEGMLNVPASLIPATGEQMALIAGLLSDFRYKRLELAFTGASTGGSSPIRLTLEGNNPAVYDGRNIKFNINLTGDVLRLVQFSFLSMTNPTSLIKSH